MRPWIAVLALGCASSNNYGTNKPPTARIISHTNATRVFSNVETEFLGEVTDPDQSNESLTANWLVQGTVGCPNADINTDEGLTRCDLTITELGQLSVTLEVIDHEGEITVQSLSLEVVDGGVEYTTDLVVEDRNNYTAQGNLQIEELEVSPGAELQMDWCDITTDDRGRDVEEATLIDRMEMREFAHTPSELRDLLATGDLDIDDAVNTFIYFNGSDRCEVSVAAFRDDDAIALDPTESLVGNGQTWLFFGANNGTVPTFDPVSMLMIWAGFTNVVDAVLTDDTSGWGFVPDMLTLDHVSTVAGHDNYVLNWSALTTDVLGNDIDSATADRLFIARTSSDLVALQQSLLALEAEAEEFYRMNVGNQTATDLMLAEDKNGTVFGGFTDQGLWLVGLECSTCMYPAPLFVTVVDVEAQTTQ